MKTGLGGRWLAATLLVILAASAADNKPIVGKVISVKAETSAACDEPGKTGAPKRTPVYDCQMRVELLNGGVLNGATLAEGENILMVTDRAHNIAPGSTVRVVELAERRGDSGAFVRVRVLEVSR